MNFFSKIDLVPLDWQERVILSAAPRLIVNGCRQAGKTTVAAAAAVHEALERPGSQTMTIVPHSGVERRFRSLVTKMLKKAGADVTIPSRDTIALANGSEIITSIPCETAGRGSSLDLIVIDEAPFVEDAIFKTFAADRLVILGTPVEARAGNFFDGAWKSGTWERVAVDTPFVFVRAAA